MTRNAIPAILALSAILAISALAQAQSTPGQPATDPKVLAFDPPSLAFVWQKGGPNPASQSVLGRNASGTIDPASQERKRRSKHWAK